MKTLLAIVLCLILFCSASHSATYYVDCAAANDNGNGKSQVTAWRTIGKINRSTFSAKDFILLKRGCVWREQLQPPSSGASGNPITFSAYGIGRNPALVCSVDLSSASAWERYSTNIWRTVNTISFDVGNIIFDDIYGGVKKKILSDMTQEHDFYHNTTDSKLYLYAVEIPANSYKTIEAAQRKNGIVITQKSHINIDGLTVKYCGGHGIGTYNGVSYLSISNNIFEWIGGSYQLGFEPGRYGNGVEFWGSAMNCKIEGNRFEQIYDSSMTVQSNLANTRQSNIVFVNNTSKNHEYCFELWSSGAKSTMTDISFKNNRCYYAGGGWSHSQRPDPNGAHLMLWDSSATVSRVQITDNIFDTASDYYISVKAPYVGIENILIDRNLYNGEKRSGFKYLGEYPGRVYSFDDWKAASGKDAHSEYRSTPLN